MWELSDEEVSRLAIREGVQIGILDAADMEEAHVVRIPKAYPAYVGSYDHFDVIRRYIDRMENLPLVGRNGMHRYNRQDHSTFVVPG
jgi:protoporphyrinogen oxidase